MRSPRSRSRPSPARSPSRPRRPRSRPTLTTEHLTGPVLRDIPEAEVLLSSRARPALEALSAEGGLRLVETRRSQAVYRLGRSLTVSHDCLLEDPSGSRARRTIVLSAGPKAPEGGATVEGGGFHLQGWVYPHDPALPGLAMWFDPESRRSLLAATGLGEAGSLRARSYRPGRRAVLELTFPDRRVFVKAVRPKAVAGLQERHRLLADRLPVPRSLGWLPDEGVVVMDGLPGRTMLEREVAPSPAEVTALLDLLPQTGFRVTPLRERAASHAERLRALLPEEAERITDLEGRLSTMGSEPSVPAHGDLHGGQLIVRGDRIVGLIDVDTVGMGERSDDLATLIGHLHVTALGGRTTLAGVGERLLAGFEADRPDLRRRIAASVFGHAAGPWTRQADDWRAGVQERLAAVEAWLGPA